MATKVVTVSEQKRLTDAREKGIAWKKWGPCLSERQWGTVREDYSEDGNAWDYFSHDQGLPVGRRRAAGISRQNEKVMSHGSLIKREN